MLYQLQKQVYANKVSRGFNTVDVGKEIILIAEEIGELCTAIIDKDLDGIVDALGDTMIYGLGLAEMFKLNADQIISVTYKAKPKSVREILPYLGKTLGELAKTYKKSNKHSVESIDKRDQFQEHIGFLLGYCKDGLLKSGFEDEQVLQGIINNNKIRTHQGQM